MPPVHDGKWSHMNTCLDCAWFELCEPKDIFCACERFARPEDLRLEIGRTLYEEWCRDREGGSEEKDPQKDAD